jgi:hypothetical protein
MPLKLTRRRVLIAGLAMLVLLAVAGWFASSYYSFDARFARSRPAIESYAAKAMASDPTKPLPPPPQRLGAFGTGSAERLPHGFLFRSDFGHPFDWNGLAYSTEPLPRQMHDPQPAFGTMYFKHVEGNWYTVFRDEEKRIAE